MLANLPCLLRANGKTRHPGTASKGICKENVRQISLWMHPERESEGGGYGFEKFLFIFILDLRTLKTHG